MFMWLIVNYREGDTDDKKAVSRLLNIWLERRVLPGEYIDNITKSLIGVAGPVNQVCFHYSCKYSVKFIDWILL